MTSDWDASHLRALAERSNSQERARATGRREEERQAWNRLRDEIGPLERDRVLEEILRKCKAAAERGYTRVDFELRVDKDLCLDGSASAQEAESRKYAGWSLLDKGAGGDWRLGPHGGWIQEQLRQKGFRVEFLSGGYDRTGAKWYAPSFAVDW